MQECHRSYKFVCHRPVLIGFRIKGMFLVTKIWLVKRQGKEKWLTGSKSAEANQPPSQNFGTKPTGFGFETAVSTAVNRLVCHNMNWIQNFVISGHKIKFQSKTSMHNSVTRPTYTYPLLLFRINLRLQHSNLSLSGRGSTVATFVSLSTMITLPITITSFPMVPNEGRRCCSI